VSSRRNSFGAPNFLVGGELFFGQDRLEAVLEGLSAPSRPSAPG
jgi:2-hydroxychromene-2-carboxylate isomerase